MVSLGILYFRIICMIEEQMTTILMKLLQIINSVTHLLKLERLLFTWHSQDETRKQWEKELHVLLSLLQLTDTISEVAHLLVNARWAFGLEFFNMWSNELQTTKIQRCISLLCMMLRLWMCQCGATNSRCLRYSNDSVDLSRLFFFLFFLFHIYIFFLTM